MLGSSFRLRQHTTDIGPNIKCHLLKEGKRKKKDLGSKSGIMGEFTPLFIQFGFPEYKANLKFKI